MSYVILEYVVCHKSYTVCGFQRDCHTDTVHYRCSMLPGTVDSRLHSQFEKTVSHQSRTPKTQQQPFITYNNENRRRSARRSFINTFQSYMTDRKDRLAALSAKAGRTKQPGPTAESNEAAKLTFRNYAPNHASLVQRSQDEQPLPAKKKLKIEEALKQAQDEVEKEFSKASDPVSSTKKINWDLKRDIELRIEKLERRTQRALVMLLKQKLEKEANVDE